MWASLFGGSTGAEEKRIRREVKKGEEGGDTRGKCVGREGGKEIQGEVGREGVRRYRGMVGKGERREGGRGRRYRGGNGIGGRAVVFLISY